MSSQTSLAHRTGPLQPGLGQLVEHYPVFLGESNPPFQTPSENTPVPDLVGSSRARTNPVLHGPVGPTRFRPSHPADPKATVLLVRCPGGRERTLRRGDSPVNSGGRARPHTSPFAARPSVAAPVPVGAGVPRPRQPQADIDVPHSVSPALRQSRTPAPPKVHRLLGATEVHRLPGRRGWGDQHQLAKDEGPVPPTAGGPGPSDFRQQGTHEGTRTRHASGRLSARPSAATDEAARASFCRAAPPRPREDPAGSWATR